MHYNLGLLLDNQEKEEEAIIEYEKCIDLDPSIKMAYNNLGLIFKQQKKFQKS